MHLNENTLLSFLKLQITDNFGMYFEMYDSFWVKIHASSISIFALVYKVYFY